MNIESKKWVWGLGLLLLGFGTAYADDGGVLDWAYRTPMSSLANGEVAKVNAPAGSHVKKGEPIITLEQPVFTSQVRAMEAKVRTTRGLRKEAKAELDRNQQMFNQAMLASHDLEVTRLAYIKADAVYQQAMAELARAKFLQQQSILRAPFDAIVLKVSVHPGEVLNNHDQSQVLAVIASSDKMLARAQVDMDDALGLKPGQNLTVKVNGKSIPGQVSAIDLSGNDGKATVEVVFPIEVNSDTVPGSKLDIEL